MRIRILDIFIVAVALMATVFVSASVLGNGGDRLIVRIDGQSGQWEYPLSQNRKIEVAGPLGSTTVLIEGGKAAIVDSPCPNKTCILAGAISRSGQWVACLPNKIFVRLVGSEGKGLDAATF